MTASQTTLKMQIIRAKKSPAIVAPGPVTSYWTISSSSCTSAASHVAADIAILHDYTFTKGDEEEELASNTIAEDVINDSTYQDFQCNAGPNFKQMNPGQANAKIFKLCRRYHDDMMNCKAVRRPYHTWLVRPQNTFGLHVGDL